MKLMEFADKDIKRAHQINNTYLLQKENKNRSSILEDEHYNIRKKYWDKPFIERMEKKKNSMKETASYYNSRSESKNIK